MTTHALSDNRRMDFSVTKELVGGGLGVAVLAWFGRLVMQRIGAGERAGTAGSEALMAIIQQQGATIKRLEERDVLATARADKAERERNEALNQIDQLTFTVSTLRDEVRRLGEKLDEANLGKH